jgi:uncharacterized protein (DUF1697 family)
MRHITFLRAINVTGRFVKMEALRAQFEALKFKDVETFINSGNVIFSSSAKSGTALETKIEKQLAAGLGFTTEAFVRSVDELAGAAAQQPFDAQAVRKSQDFNVGFVKMPLTEPQHAALMTLRNSLDDFYVHGRHVYWLTRISQHESKFSNAVFERKLNTVATWRRMSTIRNLLEKHFEE